MNDLTSHTPPDALLTALNNPVVPRPAPLTAYQHFVAMLHELKDADIETLLCAETDFANFTKPDVGGSQDWAGDIAEFCNDLIDKRYREHYAGIQHDPFVSKFGDWR